MKNRLVIVGARAMGREACAYAQEAGFCVKGFLDENTDALDSLEGYPPILSSVEDYEIVEGDVFVVALGDPEFRLKYAEMIVAKGGKFVSVVHPTAYIGRNAQIGIGCIICPHATITNDTVIGNHVIVNVNASINHDNRIGDYSTICPGCHLAGRVKLGRQVFIGTGASLIPDTSLGDYVYVAAGATVTKSFARGRIMGVPATLRAHQR